MARNVLKWLGKLAWGTLLLSLAAISVWVFSEGHPLPAFGFGFFAACGVVSWIRESLSVDTRDGGVIADRTGFTHGCESQDYSMYEATNDLAAVMAIAEGEGRVAVVASNGREFKNDDDCPFNDPYFNGDPGGMCSAPTGDDRF